jgi:hypothetical protein
MKKDSGDINRNIAETSAGVPSRNQMLSAAEILISRLISPSAPPVTSTKTPKIRPSARDDEKVTFDSIVM